jgi:large subunit ribosomal protein L28
MARICEICGKAPSRGYSIVRRGLAKKKGGVGRKITGRNKRIFKPNIQIVRTFSNGKVKRIKVCTRCLRAGRVTKPPFAATSV